MHIINCAHCGCYPFKFGRGSIKQASLKPPATAQHVLPWLPRRLVPSALFHHSLDKQRDKAGHRHASPDLPNCCSNFLKLALQWRLLLARVHHQRERLTPLTVLTHRHNQHLTAALYNLRTVFQWQRTVIEGQE